MGVLLLMPFFLIRFGLLARLQKTAIARAAHFAPMERGEMAAYWVYQLSNVAVLAVLLFSRVVFTPLPFFGAGVAVYLGGTVLLTVSIVNFAAPSASGVNLNGLYRVSRNPMYVAYFVFFLGCVLLTQSLWLLGAVVVFQVSAHWIILAEERWCVQSFGEKYVQYMKNVRRYF